MKKFYTLVFLSLSAVSFADALKFGAPIMAGPGCYPSSVSWALSPDNSSLSILFGKFSMTSGSDIGPARTYCQIMLPLSTHNQTVISADYRGFHDLPLNAISDRRVTYSLDNGSPIQHLDSVYGEDTNIYIHTHQTNITCNGTRILKIFVDSFLNSISHDRNASYTLDSIDLAEATTPNITFQICSGAAITASKISTFFLAMVALFML